MGLVNSWDCVEKALARGFLRETEVRPDAKSLNGLSGALRTWNLAGAQRYDTFQRRS